MKNGNIYKVFKVDISIYLYSIQLYMRQRKERERGEREKDVSVTCNSIQLINSIQTKAYNHNVEKWLFNCSIA